MYGYIYKITCLINNRCYVGQKRKSVFDSNYWGSSKNKEYWKDLKLFGKDNFKREILCWAETQIELNEKETEYILSENALCEKGGYNLWINRPQQELNNETIKKHHENLLKAMNSPECKEKLKRAAEKRKGIPMSKATKKKLSESIKSSEKRKKTMASKEYREKMSRSIKNSEKHSRWYKDPILRAQKFGNSFKEKISKIVSENNKGKHWFTDGKTNKFCKECPDGFIPGRSNDFKLKLSNTKRLKNAKSKK